LRHFNINSLTKLVSIILIIYSVVDESIAHVLVLVHIVVLSDQIIEPVFVGILQLVDIVDIFQFSLIGVVELDVEIFFEVVAEFNEVFAECFICVIKLLEELVFE